jgi:C-terminal processing protease CtpA/Prc
VKYSNDTVQLRKAIKYFNAINSNKGRTIYISGDTIFRKEILTLPQNIAIICNYACISASELMILDFKQSKKVKVFGENTGGSVDHLNTYRIKTPFSNYTLRFPTSIREQKSKKDIIDPKGIKPEILISCKNDDWIKFVVNYYKNK